MAWSNQPGRQRALPPDWQTIRREVLDRDDRRCQLNGPRCTGLATEVDHIGDNLNHDETNLRAACRTCHAQRSATQGHEAMRARRATAKHPRPRKHPGRT